MNIRKIITALAAALCTWTMQAQNTVVSREYGNGENGAEETVVGTTGAGFELIAPETVGNGLFNELMVPDAKVRLDTLPYSPSFEKFNPDAFSITPGPFRTPNPVNVTRTGTIGSWNGFRLTGSGNYQEYPFMMVSRNASFALGKSWGALSARAGATATNYAFMPMGTMNQFGVSASVSYAFNDRLSVTAFGRYYNTNPFVSMGTYGAISTSSYGGYVTYMGDRVGVDVGAQRYFDPMSGRWEMAPIVTPKVKLWDSVTVELPVGGAIKSAVEQHNMRRNTPPPPPPPGRR